MTTYNYESCPIEPWVAEIVQRMHEAAAVGTSLVNLSYTHPRGYIPNQIMRRPAVRALFVGGWAYDNTRIAPTPYPKDRLWLPKLGLDLDTCPTAPFEQEISLREDEALAAHRAGQTALPIVDLTPYHPRGGIPQQILKRLERRTSRAWRNTASEEASSLFGEANKAEALAKSMRERLVILADSDKDTAAMKNAIQEQIQKAEKLRQQARFLKQELGETV